MISSRIAIQAGATDWTLEMMHNQKAKAASA
jgi:hypothetical protein